ncbi:cytochrome c biogenesis CcdA family protein [Gracilinema caldarium]|uniref:Uncharacterized protein n=1 Tax=Gracilinema caldarium (strain ATCC 51460 / DSM 7334 / H1) TaxID=744872 RepID=F8F386_GRAC1|nr:cytochrome c biogenesis protein CcdA [Gracilinema caldarium]AEJ20412.1 hypothetical protein Spica_2300 [Gracilinema caldarium DSM 7334]
MRPPAFINLNFLFLLFILMNPLWAEAGMAGDGQSGETRSIPSPERRIQGVYFTETGCKHCDLFLYSQKQKYEATSGVHLDLETYDILSPEGYKRCVDLLAERGLPFTVFPVLFIGNNVYRGSTEIEQNVPLELAAIRDTGKARLTVPVSGGSPAVSLAAETKSAVPAASGESAPGSVPAPGTAAAFGTLLTILAAGLLDGINPCAFSTLLFFLSFIALRRQEKRALMIVGCSFIGAVFFAYFLMGLGLLQALRSLLSAGRATYYVKGAVSLVAAVLVVLNLRDAQLARQGRARESILQMPQGLKQLSHRVIRSFSVLPLMALGAALTGFLVSVIELACTGQVYLPTLVYMNQSSLSHWSMFLLMLYNVGFIIPLVVVFILVFVGLQHEKIRGWYGKHLCVVRLSTAVLFGVMGMVVWL